MNDAIVPFHIKQVEEVMAHPEIRALAQHDKLRSCIEGLSSEGPAATEVLVQATKKAFEAITGKLRIFLSYKRAQHADFARKLRETLQGFGAGKIDVFLDEVKLEVRPRLVQFDQEKPEERELPCAAGPGQLRRA